MNKNLILTACAAATMVFATSCDKSQDVEMNHGNAISFRTSLNSALRSNVNDVEPLKTNGFKVLAFKGTANDFFFDQKVTINNGDQKWYPEKDQYWPSKEDVKFFAFYPADAMTFTKETKTVNGFKPAAKLADQKDVLVAFNKGTKANASEGVALNFKHALSQIEIKAVNSSSDMKVDVLGVKIVNVGTTSTLTFKEEETVTAYSLKDKKWWGVANELGGYAQTYATAKTLTTDAQDVIDGANRFMLLPQTLKGYAKTTNDTGAYIALLVNIKNADGTQVYPKTAGKYGWAAVAVEGTWEPGKKYTYVLKFFDGATGGAGVQDPNQNKPGTEGGDDSGDKTDNDTGVDGGDNILNGKIKFTVTVDSWENAGSTDLIMK